eukprot:2277691-Prymnesium_polylepis.1
MQQHGTQWMARSTDLGNGVWRTGDRAAYSAAGVIDDAARRRRLTTGQRRCASQACHHNWGGRVIRWKWGMTSHDA